MFNKRAYISFGSFLLWIVLVWARFFYWQVVNGDKLAAQAISQTVQTKEVLPDRGRIYTSDGFPIVLNEKNYLLYGWLPEIKTNLLDLSEKLAPIIAAGRDDDTEKDLLKQTEQNLKDLLTNDRGIKWVCLDKNISEEQKKTIQEMGVEGLEFEEKDNRYYPEGSMAAHLLGFLGQNKMGQQTGYFGLEGYYDRQLKGWGGVAPENRGILAKLSFLNDDITDMKSNSGRSIHLFLDRAAQFIAETQLEKGINKYGAKTGWVVILEPETGGLLASAVYPKYDPQKYFNYEAKLFPNPIISETFEPGSIIKPLIAAAALEEKVIDENDKCSICNGPVEIGEYKIETWDKNHHPQATVEEILKYSDNVGMVWIGNNLGLKSILEYLEKYGFDDKTNIDLEGEASYPLRDKKDWAPIDIAASTFGQGIAVTPIQMVTAFNALANKGVFVAPRVVEKVSQDSSSNITWRYQHINGEEVVSQKTANQIKEMLIKAVDYGEAKWTKLKNYTVAGKTGTAQIAIKGNYDEEKTIASFIGFAPADNPKFTMLVSLVEPTSSQWGSETAAPLWFDIADKLLYLWGIAPQ
jgi:cell division protein FtsI/penicillin-binding protein 2